MKNRITRAVCLCALPVIILGGCAGNKVGNIRVDAGESAVYIEKDGTVSYAVSESFDKDYYDKDDLEQKIRDEIDDFNAGYVAKTTESAKLKSFRVRKKVATAVLTFISPVDYAGYIKTYNGKTDDEIYAGTVKSAPEQNHRIKGKFLKVKDGNASKETTAASEIKKLDADLLIIKDKISVQIEGGVKYVSRNCKVKDGIVTVSGDEAAYIIY